MKTVYVEYEMMSPARLELIIKNRFPQAMCKWKDINEDYFEFSVFGIIDLAKLEKVLAEFV